MSFLTWQTTTALKRDDTGHNSIKRISCSTSTNRLRTSGNIISRNTLCASDSVLILYLFTNICSWMLSEYSKAYPLQILEGPGPPPPWSTPPSLSPANRRRMIAKTIVAVFTAAYAMSNSSVVSTSMRMDRAGKLSRATVMIVSSWLKEYERNTIILSSVIL